MSQRILCQTALPSAPVLAVLSLPVLVVGLHDLFLAQDLDRRAVGLILFLLSALAFTMPFVMRQVKSIGVSLSAFALLTIYLSAFVAASRIDGSSAAMVIAIVLSLLTLILLKRNLRGTIQDFRDSKWPDIPAKAFGAAVGALIGLFIVFLSEIYLPTRSPPRLNIDIEVEAEQPQGGLVPIAITVSAMNPGSSAALILGTITEVTVEEILEEPAGLTIADTSSALQLRKTAARYVSLGEPNLIALDEPFPTGMWFEPGEAISRTFGSYIPIDLTGHVRVRFVAIAMPYHRIRLEHPPRVMEPDESILLGHQIDAAPKSWWEKLLKEPVTLESSIGHGLGCSEYPTISNAPDSPCLLVVLTPGNWVPSNESEAYTIAQHFGMVEFQAEYSADISLMMNVEGQP